MVKNLPANPRHEARVRALGQEEPLEKDMAIHSSILAWEIKKDRRDWGATIHGVTRTGHNLATEHTRIYMCVCVSVSVPVYIKCVCVYIYIEREREK